MWPTERKTWFVHNDDEHVWTKNGWSPAFENAFLFDSESDAQRIAQALKIIYPERQIDYNPIFEAYVICIENKKDRLCEDMEYTANEALRFTSHYARSKLYFDYERADKMADTIWFEMLGEDPAVSVCVCYAGGDGGIHYPVFSREEQEAWYEKREKEREQRSRQASSCDDATA